MGTWATAATATVAVSVGLGLSTLAQLALAVRHEQTKRNGPIPVSAAYLWLRLFLFGAMGSLLRWSPSPSAQTRTLAWLSYWYVVYYGVLLVLHYR